MKTKAKNPSEKQPFLWRAKFWKNEEASKKEKDRKNDQSNQLGQAGIRGIYGKAFFPVDKADAVCVLRRSRGGKADLLLCHDGGFLPYGHPGGDHPVFFGGDV